ncbi:MAG TPA: hypothetical protein VGN20_20510 [Mucilaginibacter sp.]|jgi:hypothetical protein
MENSFHIEQDWQSGNIKIYWKGIKGNLSEEWYHYDGEYVVSTQVDAKNAFRPESIKPFLTLPREFGNLFLTLISDKVNELGINQKKVDMEAGKTELLNQQLKFSQEQLVKFIDHFTNKIKHGNKNL